MLTDIISQAALPELQDGGGERRVSRRASTFASEPAERAVDYGESRGIEVHERTERSTGWIHLGDNKFRVLPPMFCNGLAYLTVKTRMARLQLLGPKRSAAWWQRSSSARKDIRAGRVPNAPMVIS